MKLGDAISAALTAVAGNPLRSGLTTLGVVIGVASVVAMVAVGRGAESRIEEAIRGIGSNVLVVGNGAQTSDGRRAAQGSFLTLTEGDAAALAREIPEIQIAAGSVAGTGQVIANGKNWFTTTRGVTPDYFDVRNWEIAEGRRMTEEETRSAAKVAIIGQTIVDEIFAGNSPLGRALRIRRTPFTIIGILAEKGPAPWGGDQDDVVFVPLRTAKMRVFGDRQQRSDLLGQITVQVTTEDAIEQAETSIAAVLRRRHHLRPNDVDDFFVSNLAEVLSARAEFSRTMAALLAAVAGVSLIVGGIGIMNIMLVSVSERRKEIGLRLAVGATRRAVMTQFVIEALVLSIFGGIVGVGIGIASSGLVSHLAGWPVLIGADAILIAAAFSVGVGVFFGYYPARKASRMDPIEALRQD